jgi:hypothetical protein
LKIIIKREKSRRWHKEGETGQYNKGDEKIPRHILRQNMIATFMHGEREKNR